MTKLTISPARGPALEGAPAGAIDGDLRGYEAEPLAALGSDWTRWAGPIVSLLILAAAAYQLRRIDVHAVIALVPVSPLFWAAFAVYYSANPLSEWVIFRRLWDLPSGALAALYRKLVSNSLLLGYLGEVYFYAWARDRSNMVAAPFGAVKDVAVLSALTGNAMTLAMVIAAAPLMLSPHLGLSGHALALSLAFMLGSSMVMTVFRRRLFSLPRDELWFVAIVHLARIVASIALSGLLWHILLPSVALSWWLLLATLRQLVSRLPFVPNKDVVFAGLATVFVGQNAGLVDAVTLVASLILLANLLVGAGLGLAELLRAEPRA